MLIKFKYLLNKINASSIFKGFSFDSQPLNTKVTILIDLLITKKDGTVLARQSLPKSGSSKN